jgi:valyl-tRNA synthetase
LIPLGAGKKEQALQEGSFRVSLEKGARPIVSRDRPDFCPQCQGEDLVQDPDVLDTWFSSALWPFATLGWPQQKAELGYFHPTDLMITARDILYLWVLRMIMTAVEFVDEIPFRTVLVHPTVLTKDGRRMSKSLGTGLNPLDLVGLYGADATRFSLLHQAGAVQDVRFDAEIENNQVQSSLSAETGRNFCNKLWNAARFVLMNLEDYDPGKAHSRGSELADRWIRSRLVHATKAVDRYLEEYRFGEVTRTLYDFLWRDYCDWYLELAKIRFSSGPSEERLQAQQTLIEVLEAALRMMHPVMPFVTEALWQVLPLDPEGRPQSIMVASWPTVDSAWIDAKAEEEMNTLQEVVTAVRTIRGDLNIPAGKRVQVLLSTSVDTVEDLLNQERTSIQLLARAEEVEVGRNLVQPPASGSTVLRGVEVYMPLEGLIDLEAEQQRLQKEIAKFQGLLKGLEVKLGNQGFLRNAPAEVVEKERSRQDEYRTSLAKLQASLERMGS